jgi:hypothetical protein
MLQRIQRFWRRLCPCKPSAACGYCGAQCLKTAMMHTAEGWFCSSACAGNFIAENQPFGM